MLAMEFSTLFVILAAVSAGDRIPANEVDHQQAAFAKFWDDEFVWEFDRLPKKSGVPSHRLPYSGYIYPDRQGGTTYPLRKYDAAFNGGRRLAANHEKWDTTAFKERVPGLFGSVFGVKHTPDWYGHCNGWTAATIRHAEPQRSVVRNSVTFTPSDIKGLLAEAYMYNEHIVLGGENEAPISAGVFHAIITNWLGRREQALGMEADPGEEKWNYPAYAYSAAFSKRRNRRVEVNMNVVYAEDSRGEWDESPLIEIVKFSHYMLELNDAGTNVGGYFFRDSSSIDMLWVPLPLKPAGEKGNESGNPYVDVENVLAIWRDSVPIDVRRKWSDGILYSDDPGPVSTPPVVSDISDAEGEEAAGVAVLVETLP
jgi:hypothetical protein